MFMRVDCLGHDQWYPCSSLQINVNGHQNKIQSSQFRILKESIFCLSDITAEQIYLKSSEAFQNIYLFI